jgi:nucleoside-triphosphatase THEP1
MGETWIISGPIGAGKTTALKHILANLINKSQVMTYGFHEERVVQGDKRIGYDLVAKMGAETARWQFARINKKITFDGNLFSFDSAAMRSLADFTSMAKVDAWPALVYFDEFGRLEANGGGLWPSIQTLISRVRARGIPYAALFTAREQNLDLLQFQIRNAFPLSKPFPRQLIVPSTPALTDAFFKDIESSLEHLSSNLIQ